MKWLEKFKASHIPVASVATGFPSGQYSLETRLEEIRYAIKSGAKEIDIVINRTLALQVGYHVMQNLKSKNQVKKISSQKLLNQVLGGLRALEASADFFRNPYLYDIDFS